MTRKGMRWGGSSQEAQVFFIFFNDGKYWIRGLFVQKGCVSDGSQKELLKACVLGSSQVKNRPQRTSEAVGRSNNGRLVPCQSAMGIIGPRANYFVLQQSKMMSSLGPFFLPFYYLKIKNQLNEVQGKRAVEFQRQSLPNSTIGYFFLKIIVCFIFSLNTHPIIQIFHTKNLSLLPQKNCGLGCFI